MPKQDIEKLLQEGKTISIKPQGSSMYPILVEGRDRAIIEPVDAASLKRGDVVLYRRDEDVPAGGILVLHRIYKCKKDGFYMVGDNQKEIEGPLRADQIKGIMVAMERNGKFISVNNLAYIMLTRIWLLFRPLRPTISRILAKIKRKIYVKNK